MLKWQKIINFQGLCYITITYDKQNILLRYNRLYQSIFPITIQIFMLIFRLPLRSLAICLVSLTKNTQSIYQSSFLLSHCIILHPITPKSIETMKNGYSFCTQKKHKQKPKTQQEPDPKQKLKSKFQSFEQRLNKKCEKLINFLKTLNTKSYYKILRIFLISLFPGSLTYLQFFGGNQISSQLQKKIKERRQNMQVGKGKKVEQLNDQKQKTQLQNTEKQLAIFQSNQYDYKQRLDHLLQLDDPKLIVFIECYSGNAVGTNLKRLAWNKIQKDQDDEEKSLERKFYQKIYYVNMKEPCLYSISKDEDQYWEEARDLNFLLSSIIGSSFKSPKKQKGFFQQIKNKIFSQIQESKPTQDKSILIIDEVQNLQHFLKDKDKKLKIQQLYKKIIYVQRKKNVRVFMIAKNSSFFNKLNRQLQNPNLQDFKYEYITQMSDDNIKSIIRCRSRMEQFYSQYPHLKAKLGQYFDKIVDFIVLQNNNTKEVVRIVKEANIDFKQVLKKKDLTGSLFWKTQKQLQLNQWISRAKQEIKKQFNKVYLCRNRAKNQEYVHYSALKKIRSRIVKISREFLDQKKRLIINQIDQSSQKDYKDQKLPSKEEIINSKIAILMLIFSKKLQKNKEAEYFLYSMNKSDALAYQQLNKAQIIHGLNFTSRAYQQALYQIFEEHKEGFKKLLRGQQREFNNQIQLHRESINKHNTEVKKLEEKLDKQLLNNV